jgi:YD repeat-containing protein
LNRLTQKLYADSTAVNYTYDNNSRLTQVTDSTGTYHFTFDNMGRLTNTATSYAFLAGHNFTTSYSYDAASNRTGFTDPESGATSYVYDTLNRLQTLTPAVTRADGFWGNPKCFSAARIACKLTQGVHEALAGLLQLALERVDLLRDSAKLLFGKHPCPCNLLSFAVRSAHCCADLDRYLSEFALFGHIYPPVEEEVIVYPKCLVKLTQI